MQVVQKRQKDYYDHTAFGELYHVGQTVYRKNKPILPSLVPKWSGPWIIMEITGKKTYKIIRATGDSQEALIVSFDNIKPSKDWRQINENTEQQKKVIKRELLRDDSDYDGSQTTPESSDESSDYHPQPKRSQPKTKAMPDWTPKRVRLLD